MAKPPADRLVFVHLLELSLLGPDLPGSVHPAREPEPRGGHERAYEPVRDLSSPLNLPASREGAEKVGEVPAPGGGHVVGILEPARHEHHGGSDDPDERVERKEPGKRGEPVVLQHGGQAGSLVSVTLGAVPPRI